MTTPGGCTDSATPTCAGGTDTVTKTWGTYGTLTNIVNNTDGMANTLALVTSYPADTLAAKFCHDMVYGGYSDWFLPAHTELINLTANRFVISGFRIDTATSYHYFSSTEVTSQTPGNNAILARAVMM